MALVLRSARGTSTVTYRHRFLNTAETVNLANHPPPGAASKRELTVTPTEGFAALPSAHSTALIHDVNVLLLVAVA